MNAFVCLYQGVPGDCQECGGLDKTGTGFCGEDCRADRQDRIDAQDAAVRARRAAEDAFAAEVDRLRGLGHSDEECDRLLVNMPT